MTLPFNPESLLQMLDAAYDFAVAMRRSQFPYLLNPQSVLRNNFHNTLGRGGYFWTSGGPTEANCIAAWACFEAYEATKATKWLTLGIELLEALITYYYVNPIPDNPQPGDPLWLNHWLINAGPSPVPTKGLAAEDPFNMGHFDVIVAFTNGVGQIDDTGNNYGSLLAEVYKVYSLDGEFKYRNVFSPLRVGSERSVSYWVTNFELSGTNYRYSWESLQSGGTPPSVTSEPAGKIVLMDSTFTGNLKVTYSSYSGPSLGVNELGEPYPMWYPINNRGSDANGNPYPRIIGSAWDAIWWMWRACDLAFKYTNDTRWERARDATKYTAIDGAIVPNIAYYNPIDGQLLKYPGTQLVTVNNRTNAIAYLETDPTRLNWVRVECPVKDDENVNSDYAFPSYEIQNYVIVTQFTQANSTQIYVDCDYENTNGASPNTYAYTDLLEVVLSASQDDNDFSKLYKAPLLVQGKTSLTLRRTDFILFDNSKNIWWSTNGDDPLFTFSNPETIITLSKEQPTLFDGRRPVVWVINFNLSGTSSYAGVGLVLLGIKPASPPSLFYSLSGGLRLRLTDSNGEYFRMVLPDTGGNWREFKPSWADFTNATNLSPVGLIQEIIFEDLGGNDAILKLWYVGDSGAELPTGFVYKASLVSRTKTPHKFWCGNFYPINNPLNEIVYNPGCVPFTVNAKETSNGSGVFVKDSFSGPYYFGYEEGDYYWHVWGLPERRRQVISFKSAAQKAYTAQNLNKSRGLFSPVFLTTYWDSADYDIYGGGNFNYFTFNGPDPNTRWSPYTFRSTRSLANYVQISPNDQEAKSILITFLQYVYNYHESSGSNSPITDIPPQTEPEANYAEPHAWALLIDTALYANRGGIDPTITCKLIQRGVEFITSQFVSSGVMRGSFSASQPTFTVDTVQYREYFGFWHFEIIMALANLVQNQHSLNLPITGNVGASTQGVDFGTLPTDLVPDKISTIEFKPVGKIYTLTFDEGTTQRLGTRSTSASFTLPPLFWKSTSDDIIAAISSTTSRWVFTESGVLLTVNNVSKDSRYALLDVSFTLDSVIA